MDIDRIERLARLLHSGSLTQEEFDQQKAALLGLSMLSQRPTLARRIWPWALAAVVSATAAISVTMFVSRNPVAPAPADPSRNPVGPAPADPSTSTVAPAPSTKIDPSPSEASVTLPIRKLLVPMSRTAIAITGPVTVGSDTIMFGKKAVKAKSLGLFWRNWADDGQDHTAEVFELSADPGVLLQGNTLCGADEPAKYVVLWESVDSFGGGVNMAVWQGQTPPIDVNSEGLCGTFSYDWKP